MSERSENIPYIPRKIGDLLGTAEFVANQIIWRLLVSGLNPFSASAKQFAAKNEHGVGESGFQLVLTDGFDIAAALSLGLPVNQVDAIGQNPKSGNTYIQASGVKIVPKNIDVNGTVIPWESRQDPRLTIDKINEIAIPFRNQGYIK